MRQKPDHENARKEEQGHGEQGGEAGGNAVVGEDGGEIRPEGAGKDDACGHAEQACHFLHQTAEKPLDAEKEQDDQQGDIEKIDLKHMQWPLR